MIRKFLGIIDRIIVSHGRLAYMRSTLVAARSFKKYVVQHGVPNLFSDPWTLELYVAWLINSAIKPYVMCQVILGLTNRVGLPRGSANSHLAWAMFTRIAPTTTLYQYTLPGSKIDRGFIYSIGGDIRDLMQRFWVVPEQQYTIWN